MHMSRDGKAHFRNARVKGLSRKLSGMLLHRTSQNFTLCTHGNRRVSQFLYLAQKRNPSILHDTGLELCQAPVGSIKRMVHMYTLTGKIHLIYTQLAIN